MGTLTLGYSKYGNAGRGLWMWLQAMSMGLGLTLTGHLAWYIFVSYIVLMGAYGGIYRNWQQKFGDFGAGFGLSLILWFVH